jgi:hypothetical protein
MREDNKKNLKSKLLKYLKIELIKKLDSIIEKEDIKVHVASK